MAQVDGPYTISEDGSVDSTDDWYDSNWSFRRTLSFDNLAQVGDLSEFPVLVKLDSTRINYEQTKANGVDLRFVDGDGNLLDHEVEQWDDSGTSYVWVKVPVVDGGSDTDFIWMYYGNAAAPFVENPSAVWSNGYRATYHLNENPGGSGTVLDATGNFDATNGGSTDVAGQIGNAQQFDGAGDYINMGDDQPFLNDASEVTISAWVNVDLISGQASILGVSIDNGGMPTVDSRATLNILDDEVLLSGIADDSAQHTEFQTTSGLITRGQWHYITGVIDYSTASYEIYVDGVAQPTVSGTGVRLTAPATSNSNSERAVIGTNEDFGSNEFGGVIDEARLSDTARSADWIAAQYASMTDNFVTYGYQQTVAGVLGNDIDSDSDQLTAVLVGSAPTNAQSFVLNPDGSFTYTPNADFFGVETFTYKATAGGVDSNTVTVTINVDPVNDDPTFTSSNASSIPENTTVVHTVAATDVDGDVPTYSITGGADQGLFAIDAVTGDLTFLAAPNFESPGDSDTDNVYQLQVTADDGNGGSATQSLSVTVTDVNENPVITSASTASVPENTTAVLTVTSSDVDGDVPTYSITGGADQGLFAIDSVTGDLTFLAAPNFEAPGDSDTDNVYQLQVTADDGNGGSATQSLSVTVTDVNENPAITSASTASVPENRLAVLTVTSSDVDGDVPTYSITGGADQGLFAIDSVTGDLTFLAAPNFEAPGDSDTDNVYQLQVTADDGNGGSATQSLSVTVTDVNEDPAITSASTASVPENTTAVLTVTSIDVDGDVPTYSITGGADQGLFAIDSVTGELTFLAAPNFEAPGDSDTDNVYQLQVTADDGNGGSATQSLSVTVTDVNENPAITSASSTSVPENSLAVLTVTSSDVDGDVPTYSITGGADQGLFAINGVTGDLTFLAAPNFEAPGDSDTDNVYQLQVTADDGNGGSATQSLSVTVTDVNENPAITSASSTSVPENTLAVLTVTSSDVDGDMSTYSITRRSGSGPVCNQRCYGRSDVPGRTKLRSTAVTRTPTTCTSCR